ncbi:MAG: GatB/YqeY domain-containing protein [Melioribacteraceae bacterium]|nr:GatB/YqeY domain-containing protein [Melioribacteraceae bacterium]MDD3557699.1 GatB/YqeY domain-containing protein [Melioribacteraceae bacterium]
MTLKEKINNDLKDAMRSKDKIKLETIRSIRALILEFEKSGSHEELNEEKEINLLTSAAKKRKEAIEQYENAGRQDIADKERAELEIIQSYLPKQLSVEEVEAEVRKIADEIGAVSKTDFAKLVPASIKQLKGKADGKLIKEIVEKVLSAG